MRNTDNADPMPMDTQEMLNRAEARISKLESEVKEAHAEIEYHIKKWQFYEQIVKNLTTFK